MIYLDYAAASPALPEMFASQELFSGGCRETEQARAQIARLLGGDPAGACSVLPRMGEEPAHRPAGSVRPEEIIFTSGGTESNNMSIFGSLKPMRGIRRIVTTETEHPSVYETISVAAGLFSLEIAYAPLRPDGAVDVDRLSDVLTADTGLVSIMHVNNELGSVNDLDLNDINTNGINKLLIIIINPLLHFSTKT